MVRKPPADANGTLARRGAGRVSPGPGKPQGGASLRAEPESSAILSFLDALGRLAAELWDEGRLLNFPSNKETPDDDE
jgi:hypothetical protein